MSVFFANAQQQISPHEQQSHKHPVVVSGAHSFSEKSGSIAKLSHVVFGYHPYWIGSSSIDRYRFDLLSHVAYFSYEVNGSTGLPNTIRDWLTTPLIEKAKAAGVKVSLTVTNFGSANNTALLSSQSARDTLIANAARLVKQRNADGVNIDFEAVGGSQRANLVAFFRDLRAHMDKEIPGGVISVAAPAVDWNNAWDIAALSQSIDIFFVMCYDYYWSGSATAGPVSPLQTGNYNVKKSLEWYIAQGAPRNKLVMGVPYYGYDWPTIDDSRQSPTTGSATAVTYSSARSALLTHTRQWDDAHQNPWYKYFTSNWRQTWYDDEQSLALKYDLALSLGIGGVGMWALGYDGAHPELWNLIEQKFTTTVGVAPLADGSDFVRVFPNPAFDAVTVQSSDGDSPTEVIVTDALGREVVRTRFANQDRISLGGRTPGVYRFTFIQFARRTSRTVILLR